MEVQSDDPLVGQVLQGRYKVRERVGAGGMGTVYRAVQVPFERDVAVKVLGAEHSRKEQLVQRFATEALIIAKLRHPNTLKLYDFGRAEDGRLYIVTEFLSGQPLDELLKVVRTLSEARVMKIIGQVCDSLAEAHAHGIVHRDLKPANIFIEHIGDQEIVKVLDFGVARVAETHSHTITGTIFGTPAYMSPEQAHGEDVDGRSDLYALGIIAYQCLAGRVPFTGTTPMSVLLKHIKDTPTPLLDLRPPPEIHPQVDGWVMQLLEKSPGARPATAGMARGMIDGILRHVTADPVMDQRLDGLRRERPSAGAILTPDVLDEAPEVMTPIDTIYTESIDSAATVVSEVPALTPAGGAGRRWAALAAVAALGLGAWHVWSAGHVNHMVEGLSQATDAVASTAAPLVTSVEPARVERASPPPPPKIPGLTEGVFGPPRLPAERMGPPRLGPERMGPPHLKGGAPGKSKRKRKRR